MDLEPKDKGEAYMRNIPLKKLTVAQRRRFAIIAVLQVSLTGAALWDIRRRSPDEINGDKRLWMVAAFVNFVGPIAYFLFGRKTL